MKKREWLLRQNCSLSPRQSITAYAALCCVPLMIAMPFALYGAWLVLVFAILEMLIVVLAFFHYASHASDHEHIILIDGALLVERVQGRLTQQTRLDTYWIRVGSPRREQDLIKLEAKNVKIEVGRFVTLKKRRQFAEELRQALRDD